MADAKKKLRTTMITIYTEIIISTNSKSIYIHTDTLYKYILDLRILLMHKGMHYKYYRSKSYRLKSNR